MKFYIHTVFPTIPLWFL